MRAGGSGGEPERSLGGHQAKSIARTIGRLGLVESGPARNADRGYRIDFLDGYRLVRRLYLEPFGDIDSRG